MECKEEKKLLRQSMLHKRLQMNAIKKEAYDNDICSQLLKLIAINNYQVIHTYIPMANEINITPLLQQLLNQNKTIVCPKTLPARLLENRILSSLQDLETGIKGTQHPAAAKVYEGKYDLIIVPGLAFDKERYRLGYGGGYYDNFLATQQQAFKVGIFYPFQHVEAVPREAHDVCLDAIMISALN